MQNHATELAVTLVIGGTNDSPTRDVASALVTPTSVPTRRLSDVTSPSFPHPSVVETDEFALDLAEHLSALAADGQRGAAVVDLHPSVDLTETALVLSAVFSDDATDGIPVCLGEIIVVVSAVSVRAELFDGDSGEVDFVTPERLCSRIEFATVVVVTDCHRLSRASLREVLGLIQKLAPRAPRLLSSGRIDPEALARHAQTSRAGVLGGSAGWMRELSGRGELPTSISGISTFVFDDPRPFHPARLARVVENSFEPEIVGRILRSRGFIRLASRPAVVGSFASAGRALTIEATSMPSWSVDSPVGQQVVFFGKDLDRKRLADVLNSALLTAHELGTGPLEWAGYSDPFPAWHDAETGH